MSGPRKDNDILGKSRVNLDEDRGLELRHGHGRPDKIDLLVEYVGGRIKVFEVDRHLIERLLEQLEDRGT
jgi:hypothetical protein